MRLHISLNGNDIEMYHLTALDGTLDALIKPSAFKKMVTNENAAMDGTSILSEPSARKRDKRSVSIPFLLRSTSLVDLQVEIQNLETALVQGKNGTGINELYVQELNQCYRLCYESMPSYSNFGLDGAARITLKFTEPNPTNRSV